MDEETSLQMDEEELKKLNEVIVEEVMEEVTVMEEVMEEVTGTILAPKVSHRDDPCTFVTYNMKFVPFIGIDNHWKCVTLDSGMLLHEDTQSYMWLLTTFMSAFLKEPTMIVTGQDGAMKRAIEVVISLKSQMIYVESHEIHFESHEIQSESHEIQSE
ncbi:FAR1-related sequence 5-like protein [Tanacetum coccineum]